MLIYPLAITGMLLLFFFLSTMSFEPSLPSKHSIQFCKIDKKLYDLLYSVSPNLSKACDRVNWQVNRLCHDSMSNSWSVVHVHQGILRELDTQQQGWLCVVPKEACSIDDVNLHPKCMYMYKLPINSNCDGVVTAFTMGHNMF